MSAKCPWCSVWKTKEHRHPAVPLPTSGCGRLGNARVEEEEDGKSPPKSAACKIFPCLAGVQTHNAHSASDSVQGLPPILSGLLKCLKMSFSWGWRATRERNNRGIGGEGRAVAGENRGRSRGGICATVPSVAAGEEVEKAQRWPFCLCTEKKINLSAIKRS